MSSDRVNTLKSAWNARHSKYGATKRAVLLKRLPAWTNYYIHARHMRFIKSALTSQMISVLDIGCGYGRISRELKKFRPTLKFQGVELCGSFAQQFRKELGPCYDGPINEFNSDHEFDLVIIVTLLMYIQKDELDPIIKKIWRLLAPGGTLICIEPASELFHLWRSFGTNHQASPTGGQILYFDKSELADLFQNLPGAKLINTTSISLIPFAPATAIHHGISVRKLLSEISPST